MQIVRRPLAPGETNHELLWLSVSSGGLALAATWLALRLPWPICLFHALTDRPCLTCGATRSAVAFFHAHFLTAFQCNPLAKIVRAHVLTPVTPTSTRFPYTTLFRSSCADRPPLPDLRCDAIGRRIFSRPFPHRISMEPARLSFLLLVVALPRLCARRYRYALAAPAHC